MLSRYGFEFREKNLSPDWIEYHDFHISSTGQDIYAPPLYLPRFGWVFIQDTILQNTGIDSGIWSKTSGDNGKAFAPWLGASLLPAHEYPYLYNFSLQ